MSESSLPLVTRALARNQEAVEQLLVQHLPGLRAWLRLRMGPGLRARETPDDLVQSVAREVLLGLDGFEWRGEAAFRHWLYLKAQRKLVDKARFVGAEQQKARLAMGGWAAKVTEREQAGRTVWRVRIGPYATRAEADAQQQKLVDQGIEAQIVRVEKT
jgi:DNA-directed RNA polymerase specialized sigma24 family protein